MLGLFVALLLIASPALAAEPAPSCPEQLLVKSLHNQVLYEHRATVEQQLAQAHAFNSVLQQKLKLVTAENETLKAKLKEPAPREP